MIKGKVTIILYTLNYKYKKIIWNIFAIPCAIKVKPAF